MKIVKICEHCQKEFTLNAIADPRISDSLNQERLKKRFCSHSCAGFNSNRIFPYKERQKWGEEELEHLKKLIGKYPKGILIKKHQDYLKKTKKLPRTDNAILIKAKRLAQAQGTTLDPDQNYWTLTKLSDLLGVNYDRVRNWYRRRILSVINFGGNEIRITRKNFKQFAAQYPEELGGIEPKRLRATVKDSALVKGILVATNYAPKQGRKMTIVRLDTGDVFDSARQAACTLAPLMRCSEQAAKSSILRVSKRESPMRNGMDFFQLDYPLFWVPHEMRSEFNYLAGKVLHSLFLDICQVVGYKKQSCLTVAARLAIEITLLSFRMKNAYEKYNNPKKELSREAIADFYEIKFKEKLFYVYNLQPGLILKKISFIIQKRLSRQLFASAKGDRVLYEEYAQEFVNYYIQSQTKQYFKKQFLPKNYSPQTKLERADLWAYIYNSLNLYIKIGSEENNTLRSISWLSVKWIHFSRKYQLDSEEVKKLTSLSESWKEHNPQQKNSNAAEELEAILAAAKKVYDEHTYEQLSLFVALKLEEASDIEIADCLGISLVEIPKMILQLKKLDCH